MRLPYLNIEITDAELYYKGLQWIPLGLFLLYIVNWILASDPLRFLIRPHNGSVPYSQGLPEAYRGSLGHFIRVLLLVALGGVALADLYFERFGKQPRKLGASLDEKFLTLCYALHAAFYLLNAIFLQSNRSADRGSVLLPFYWVIMAACFSARVMPLIPAVRVILSSKNPVLALHMQLDLAHTALLALLCLTVLEHVILFVLAVAILPLAVVGGLLYVIFKLLTCCCTGGRDIPYGWKPPKVLIVGAGAVGQVYGRHLAMGGADVTFYVKERHKEDMIEAQENKGLALYNLNNQSYSSRLVPVRFRKFQVVTTAAEIATSQQQRAFDQLWLCVDSTALHGPWLEGVLRAVGPQATVLVMTPGLEDRNLVSKYVQEERMVFGVINMISYEAPLPNVSSTVQRATEKGIAYYIPVIGGSQPMAGLDPARVKGIVTALKAGKMASHVDVQAVEDVKTMSSVLMTLLMALEAAEWSLAKLRAPSSLLPLAMDAAQECINIGSKITMRSAPFFAKLAFRPLPLALVSYIAPHVLPLPIEEYLEYHFSKVGNQTRYFIATFVRLAQERHLPAHALLELSYSYYNITGHEKPTASGLPAVPTGGSTSSQQAEKEKAYKRAGPSSASKSSEKKQEKVQATPVPSTPAKTPEKAAPQSDTKSKEGKQDTPAATKDSKDSGKKQGKDSAKKQPREQAKAGAESDKEKESTSDDTAKPQASPPKAKQESGKKEGGSGKKKKGK